MNVLFISRQVKLGDLAALAGTIGRELYVWVADLDLLVCGPLYWFYYGIDGKPETVFTLEVVLPVQGKIPTAVLPFFKKMPAFRCLSARYAGCWEGLPGQYEQMMQHLDSNDLKMSGIYAESFLHIDLENPRNHITEIQIGIHEGTESSQYTRHAAEVDRH